MTIVLAGLCVEIGITSCVDARLHRINSSGVNQSLHRDYTHQSSHGGYLSLKLALTRVCMQIYIMIVIIRVCMEVAFTRVCINQ